MEHSENLLDVAYQWDRLPVPGSLADFEATALFGVASRMSELILGGVTLRTRSLWLAIGLHAGWVFGLKSFSRFTRRADRDTLPWIGENLLDGIAPLLVLALTATAAALYLRSHARMARPRP